MEEPLCLRKIPASKNNRDKRRGRVSQLSVETLLSHSTEKLRTGNLPCFRKLLPSQNFMGRRGEGGSITISPIENLSHSTAKIRGGTLLCFRKFLVSKKVWDKRRGRVSRISVENLFSHSTDKLRRGKLCFRKVLVSQNFMEKTGREGGSITIFRRNFLTLLKKFVEEPFCVLEKCWYRTILGIRERAGITTSHRKFVVSQYRKTS